MTDASHERTQKIVEFKTKLRNLRKNIDNVETPMLDPADIDVETDSNLPERIKATIEAQTVHRDLNWYISESTHIVSYYPDDKIDISKGVSDEDTRGLEDGKFVYVICPRKRTSPFMKIAHKVFSDENEFFSFFENKMKTDLEYYARKK